MWIPEWDQADTGNLNEDPADVFEAIGEAAQEKQSGVVFLVDEIQFLTKIELEALIGAVHRTVQRQLPITFAGAGLPQLPGGRRQVVRRTALQVPDDRRTARNSCGRGTDGASVQ